MAAAKKPKAVSAVPPASAEVREMVNAWLDGMVEQLTAVRHHAGGGLLAPHLSDRQRQDLRGELDNAIAALSTATVVPDRPVATEAMLAALREGGAA